MRITFYGAAQTVTGSKHLIETEQAYRVLLDCGMFQGGGKESREKNYRFGFEPHLVHDVILSHAHIDHSGLLPRLVAQDFKGKIYCTPATLSLCEIMLMDSAYIQENDLKYINRRRKNRGEEPIAPLYDTEDVFLTLQKMEVVNYGEWRQINEDVKFMFTDAGHILGSAAVNLEIQDAGELKKLTFTGDIGRCNDDILRKPQPFPQADYIICESTYGNRLHANSYDTMEHLRRIVQETCAMKKGKLIIPAFSVDRTQELIYMLDRLHSSGKLPSIPVFVDSPLSVKATQVMKKHEENFNPEILDYIKKDGDAFAFPNLTYVSDVKESKKLNAHKGPCIIISASGMAEAGRIKHHLANNIEDPKNCVLIVGYCTPSSLGGALRARVPYVTVFGERRKVNATVEIMDEFSAHGDYKEMLHYLSCQDVPLIRKLFLVHGENEVQDDFKLKLIAAGFHNVEIPEMEEEFDL